MSNLANITTQELRDDLAETIEDIEYCRLALDQGVNHYGGSKRGSTTARLRANQRIKTVIETELQRREEATN